MSNDPQTLLTRQEVAQRLKLSLRSVDRLCSSGVLPAVRILRTVRFREADVAALIEPRRWSS